MWDFDVSPENKLATTNAGPPVKKSVKPPKKKGQGSEDDAPGAAESAEVVWWEYGLGPQLTDEQQAQKATAVKGAGLTGQEDDIYQHEENGKNATLHDDHSRTYQY